MLAATTADVGPHSRQVMAATTTSDATAHRLAQTWNAAMNGNLAYSTDIVTKDATLIVFPPIAGG